MIQDGGLSQFTVRRFGIFEEIDGGGSGNGEAIEEPLEKKRELVRMEGIY